MLFPNVWIQLSTNERVCQYPLTSIKHADDAQTQLKILQKKAIIRNYTSEPMTTSDTSLCCGGFNQYFYINNWSQDHMDVKWVAYSNKPTGNYHMTLQSPLALQRFIASFS